ncbi:MAG: hypothetical protein H0U79_04035 [Solirubrobacterales bacterium]|nr:hypothetical protein [Solirubrobacterales bacterium]
MQRQDDKPLKEPELGLGADMFSGGMMTMVVVCCGGQALAVGALGGLALGGALGVGAGVLAAVLLVVGVVAMRRRRASHGALPRTGRPSS